MNTYECERNHLKYYKIYTQNQHTNLSIILEWQGQLQMVNHKNYNLNVNEDFGMVLTSRLIMRFVDSFAFIMKSQSIAYY